MALFNAVRRYLVPANDAAESTGGDGKADGIVVVGDGNTPRTAALFAFRMRGWKCYSVDPAMEKDSSEVRSQLVGPNSNALLALNDCDIMRDLQRSKGWTDVANLVVVRNKIENVRISLRRAVVVLVHAHVTLAQALSAVQAEQVVGVITMPCCNWYSRQETLFARGPDLVYDDFSVLSDHRELRLWVGGDGGDVDTSHADLSLTSSVMKGCVRKELIANDDRHSASAPRASTGVDDSKRRRESVLTFLDDVLDEQSRLTDSNGEQEEQTMGSSLPTAVASHLPMETHVLVLDWSPRHPAARGLLRDGYTNVYSISADENEPLTMTESETKNVERLRLKLHKCSVRDDTESGSEAEEEMIQLEACGHLVLESSVTMPTNEGEEEEQIRVSFEAGGGPAPPLECVLDAGFLFRGFRGRAKKNTAFFRRLCRTLDQCLTACNGGVAAGRSAALICLTPSKQWRRKEFLAHAELGYDVRSLIAVRQQAPDTPVYVYCCHKRLSVSAGLPELHDPTQNVRDNAIARCDAMEKELAGRQRELSGQFVTVDSPAAWITTAKAQEQAESSTFVQVTGEITRIRRFSNGMAFVSLALSGGSVDDQLVQVFLQRETLHWSPLTFAAVGGLLRKGDKLVALGYVARNARGHSMVQAEALALERNGAFEAYD
ncbi:hypothetical protein BBJ28_00001998 [Nothophytophthora sp. Chile5]|nr:hypothetical protein BBJ28_00001998 [Nothophytophthora sp. Chile5]